MTAEIDPSMTHGKHDQDDQRLGLAAPQRPSDSRAWRRHAADLQRTGRAADAAVAWQKAVDLDQNDASALHGLGEALTQLGRPQEADAALQAAFAVDPGIPGLGARLEEAGVAPARLIEMVLSSPHARGGAKRPFVSYGIRRFAQLRRARRAAASGHAGRAADIYAGLAERSDDPVALIRHGDAIAALRGPAAARDVYLKAVAVAPDDRRSRRRAIDAREGLAGFVVRPKVALRVDADGSYVTLSDDAQFQLDPDGRALPSGWTLISIQAEAPVLPIRPVIYAFHGENGSQVTAFTFPPMEGKAEIRCLLPLPAGVTRLRLDPTGHAGVRFLLHRVSWLDGGGLGDTLFVPAPAGLAFVGEEPDAAPPAWPELRPLTLRSQHDLAILADGSFLTTGDDPQFDVTEAAELGGWTWIDLAISGVATPLDPVLYAWTEGKVVIIRLPRMERSGAIRALVQLPDRLSQLRFDPTMQEGARFGRVTLGAVAMPRGNQVLLPYRAGASAQPGAGPWDDNALAAVYTVTPRDELEAVATSAPNGVFRTTGDAPRFEVATSASRFPAGLVRLTLEIAEADQTIAATLYAFDDAGHAHSYRLGAIEPNRQYDYHLVLPEGTRSLQFAPELARHASLALPCVELLALDAADDASYVVARHDDPVPTVGSSGVPAELQPLQHLETQGQAFRTTGHDPQFHVSLGGHAFPRGWTVVTVEMDVVDTLARPILYVWSGSGVTPIQLTSLGERGRGQMLVHLPDDVAAMRFDPADVAGVTFAEPRLGFSPASHFAGRVLSRLPKAGRRVDYETWCDLYDRIRPIDRKLIQEAIERFVDTPLISVLMPVYEPEPRFLKRALDTVIDQLYPHWELCIAEDCSPNEEIRTILRDYAARDARIKIVFRQQNGHISRASNSALELVTGDFVALMDHDDELPPHALYLVANEINRFPDTDIIYTDEDKIDEHGRRHDPYFKNDWNQELFYSQNCVAHLGVYRTELMRAVGGFRAGFEGSQDYDLTLRVLRISAAERIRHIPHVLYHWRIFDGVRTFSSDNPSNSVSTARRAMDEYFAQAEPDSVVTPIPYFPGWWRIRRPLPAKPPRVSIIIPTRDRIELVRNCVDGILNRTDYPDLDVVIVDNGSTEAASLNYLTMISHDPRVSVLRDDGPFNYSRLNNVAVARAIGDYVCFLNNDIETIAPDWLTELVSQAVRPGVGAVGTRLLYASGTLQHAGISMGVYGVAAHSHRHFPGDSIGYFGHPQLVREVSAVTAAALLMPKDLFLQVGGFDEDNLAVSYNDVDLCLRIRAAGRRVLYTPFAALYHLESASRGPDVTLAQQELQRIERGYMTARWAEVIEQDPFYSRNLTVTNEDSDLAFPPRASRPWLDEADVAERLARLGQASLPRADAQALSSLAADTAIVIAGPAPFATLAALARDLRDGELRPLAIILVDNVARKDGFVGRGSIAAFRQACPHITLTVIDDPEQDYNAARTANLGLAQVLKDCGHAILIVEDCRFNRDWFAALLRSWLAIDDPAAVLSTRMFVREGRARDGVLTDGYLEVPAAQAASSQADVHRLDEGYAGLPTPGRVAPADVIAGRTAEPTDLLAGGVVMGRSATLRDAADDAGAIFDPLFLLAPAMLEDLALRLRSKGVRCYATLAALGVLAGPRPRDNVHLWQYQHDYRWLNRKLHGPVDDGTIEFICPFHRGDVLVGLQVAHTAFLAGLPIRLHVAESLLDWVMAFDPPFPVRAVPVKVPSAEETAFYLLRAFEHVVRQPDTAPRIARSHFARGLDAMNNNLATVMLSSVGLSPATPLDNLQPPVTPAQEAEATALLAPFGDRVILFHRTGGWSLKSLPDEILAEFSATVKAEGFRLVQIGGPGEAVCEEADGMIAGNLDAGVWTALFRRVRAVAGIDSWTAHMAALLDVPQITFFGSTHPDHVASKPYFRVRRSPALLIDPTVPCSPCNSLVCLIQPRPFCVGYSADPVAIRLFLHGLAPAPVERSANEPA